MSRPARALLLALALLPCWSDAARAEPAQLLVSARLGAAFPDVLSRLGPSYVVGVEAGVVFPQARRRFALVLDGAFTAPEASGSGSDARLGPYAWTLSQREVILGLSAVYRLPLGGPSAPASFGSGPVRNRFTLALGLGPRLFVLDSRTGGSAGGAAFVPRAEVGVAPGGGLLVGLGARLGPGDLFADARFEAAPLSNRQTGSSVAGGVFLAGGYRFVF